MPKLRLAAAMAAFAVLVIAPSAAQAGDIKVESGKAVITSDAGIADVLWVTAGAVANSIEVRAYPQGANGSAFAVGTNCSGPVTEFGFYRKYTCTGTNEAVVTTGDLNDSVYTTFCPSGCLFMTGKLTVDLGTGDDYLEGGNGVDVVTAGDGNDFLYVRQGNDEVNGGEGADTAYLLEGDDKAAMGGGRDFVYGGPGGDDVDGGPGFDVMDYGDSPEAVNVTLDDSANDGPATGNKDNIRKSIDDVYGTNFNDVITGDEDGNTLEGRGGNDIIDGGTGVDSFRGGPGDDQLISLDGVQERVECQDGTGDVIRGDTIDEHSGCETQQLSSDLQPDRDGDGIAKPADCNDDPASGGANIKPGATDIPDNGIDENCDNVDAVNNDKDGDGVPKASDCDDANPGVRPGAKEVVGNAADEDCDGFADPFPVISATVDKKLDAFVGFTTVARMNVMRVPKGATVNVRCRGKGCPFKTYKVSAAKKALAKVNLKKKFGRAKLRNKAKIEIRITQPGVIGRYVRFSIFGNKLPTEKIQCLQPGQTKPTDC